eukprot:COSAG06_NODE_26909_length_605_cov_0.573123_2_plen_91_part_01
MPPREECISFLGDIGHDEEEVPHRTECEAVFLGPTLGFVNILVYNEADGTCEISMAELSAVCSGAMFQTCLDYIQSSGTGPQCESVFLGPD